MEGSELGDDMEVSGKVEDQTSCCILDNFEGSDAGRPAKRELQESRWETLLGLGDGLSRG